jgi:outer membrane protein OmpA-like peptidoglycan-associated protein
MNRKYPRGIRRFEAGALALALAGIPSLAGASDPDPATAAAIERHFGGKQNAAADTADPTASADAMVAFFTSEMPAEVTVATRRHVDLDIRFEFDSSDLDQDGIQQLDVAGAALSTPQLKTRRFMLAGHTDDLGNPAYNRDLSLRRAKAARQYLIDEYGIDPDRLESQGFGSEQPKSKEPTADARKANRRVVLEMVE